MFAEASISKVAVGDDIFDEPVWSSTARKVRHNHNCARSHQDTCPLSHYDRAAFVCFEPLEDVFGQLEAWLLVTFQQMLIEFY